MHEAASSGSYLLAAGDDVAIALADLPAGAAVAGMTPPAAVPRGHKFALHLITANATVRRYGQIIGEASRDIAAGTHVQVQNLSMSLHALHHDFGSDLRHPAGSTVARAFQGYRRADGRAGSVTIWAF